MLERHLFNPCSVRSYPVLAPLGHVLAMFSAECPCCDGARLVVTLLLIPVAFVSGACLF